MMASKNDVRSYCGAVLLSGGCCGATHAGRRAGRQAGAATASLGGCFYFVLIQADRWRRGRVKQGKAGEAVSIARAGVHEQDFYEPGVRLLTTGT